MRSDSRKLVLPVSNPGRNGSLDLFCPARLFAVLILVLGLSGHVWAQSPSIVKLAWDPNPEVDLAGYVLVWGPFIRTYDGSLTVGKEATSVEAPCPSGATRYFALQAKDTSNRLSGYSNEVRVTCATGVIRLVPQPLGNVVVVVVRRG
jgi:hypothetical protein